MDAVTATIISVNAVCTIGLLVYVADLCSLLRKLRERLDRVEEYEIPRLKQQLEYESLAGAANNEYFDERIEYLHDLLEGATE